MVYEGLLVVLKSLQFFAERSTEFLKVQHGVVVPLLCFWEEECVTKEFPVFVVSGGAATAFLRGGRAMRKESKYQARNFDSIRGYPGEDHGGRRGVPYPPLGVPVKSDRGPSFL